MKALLFSFCLLCTPFENLRSQNHDFFWPMGYGNFAWDTTHLGGFFLYFGDESPSLHLQKRHIDLGMYCGVCSDSLGQDLLFYTNGMSIQNMAHEIMENGDTINPGPVWIAESDDQGPNYPMHSGGIALPDPRIPNRYFLVHMAVSPDLVGPGVYQGPLYFSLVDMNENAGLGKVVQKNRVMVDEDLIQHCAVKHGNGRDWWIMSGAYNQPKQYLFLLSPDGVSGPFVQEIGPAFPLAEGGGNSLFTPDGNTYIRLDGRNGPRIYDFDRCTGSLSNLRILPFTGPFYATRAAVSADSRFLYLVSAFSVEIAQVDLKAPDISASLDIIAVFDGFASLFPPLYTTFFMPSLAPNGKIYIATGNGTKAMHIIHNPELPGLASDVQQHGLSLPKYNARTICRFPNYRLSQWQDAPCDTLAFSNTPGFVVTLYDAVVTEKSKAIGSDYTMLPAIGGAASSDEPNYWDYIDPIDSPAQPDYEQKLKAFWEAKAKYKKRQ